MRGCRGLKRDLGDVSLQWWEDKNGNCEAVGEEEVVLKFSR